MVSWAGGSSRGGDLLPAATSLKLLGGDPGTPGRGLTGKRYAGAWSDVMLVQFGDLKSGAVVVEVTKVFRHSLCLTESFLKREREM